MEYQKIMVVVRTFVETAEKLDGFGNDSYPLARGGYGMSKFKPGRERAPPGAINTWTHVIYCLEKALKDSE